MRKPANNLQQISQLVVGIRPPGSRSVIRQNSSAVYCPATAATYSLRTVRVTPPPDSSARLPAVPRSPPAGVPPEQERRGKGSAWRECSPRRARPGQPESRQWPRVPRTPQSRSRTGGQQACHPAVPRKSGREARDPGNPDPAQHADQLASARSTRTAAAAALSGPAVLLMSGYPRRVGRRRVTCARSRFS